MGKVPDEKAAWGSITRPSRAPDATTGSSSCAWMPRCSGPMPARSTTASSRPGRRSTGDVARAPARPRGDQPARHDEHRHARAAAHPTAGARDVDLYLVRVFYRARQILAKAGFIDAARRGPHVAQHLGGGARGTFGGPAQGEVASAGVLRRRDGDRRDRTRRRTTRRTRSASPWTVDPDGRRRRGRRGPGRHPDRASWRVPGPGARNGAAAATAGCARTRAPTRTDARTEARTEARSNIRQARQKKNGHS